MSIGFYNYDTRGASPSTQIINLERMVEDREDQISKLHEALAESEKEIERREERIDKLLEALAESEKEIERLRAEITMITLENQRLMEPRSDMTLSEIEQSRLTDSLIWALNEIKRLRMANDNHE